MEEFDNDDSDRFEDAGDHEADVAIDVEAEFLAILGSR